MNGTVNSVGSVPAASSAANVGPVQSYWTDLTLIPGFAFSNSLTCVLNAVVAAAVVPGTSDATLMFTVGVFAAAVDVEPCRQPQPAGSQLRRPRPCEWMSSFPDFESHCPSLSFS